MHRRGFSTFCRGCVASQRVAGPYVVERLRGIKHVSGIKAGNEGHTVTAMVWLLMGDLIGKCQILLNKLCCRDGEFRGVFDGPFWGTPELYKGVLTGKCLQANAPYTASII